MLHALHSPFIVSACPVFPSFPRFQEGTFPSTQATIYLVGVPGLSRPRSLILGSRAPEAPEPRMGSETSALCLPVGSGRRNPGEEKHPPAVEKTLETGQSRELGGKGGRNSRSEEMGHLPSRVGAQKNRSSAGGDSFSS